MKIAIIGPWSYNYLAIKMYRCKQESDFPKITTVVCGCTYRDSIENLVSYQWAINNNIPVEFIIAETISEMIDKVIQQIDFAIILLHKENEYTNRFIMQLKEAKKPMWTF